LRKSCALRMFILALAALLLLSCTGCWDRREIDQLTVVTMLGFDRVIRNGKPQIVISILSVKNNAIGPSGGTGGSSTTIPFFGSVEAATGETIDDALRNLSLRLPRAIFLGHAVVILIGQQMARDGIQQVIDFCDRDKDIRYRTQVAISRGSALEALESQPEIETLSSMEILKIINTSKFRSSKTVPSDLLHVVYNLLTPGRDVVMPWLVMFRPPERGSTIRKGPPNAQSEESGKQGQQSGAGQGLQGGTGQQGGTGVQTQQGSALQGQVAQQDVTGADQDINQALGIPESLHPDRKTQAVDGSAVFLGDKLVGRLDENESMGVMFLNGQAIGGVIPLSFRSSEPNASFSFRRVRVSVKPVVSHDGVAFEVRIKGSGGLAEDKDAAIDVMNEDDLKAAKQLIDAEAERYCREAVAKCQSLKSDVFGFGDLLHKSDPAFWRQIKDQWRDYFPIVKVQVTANFTIEQAGVVGEAIKVK